MYRCILSLLVIISVLCVSREQRTTPPNDGHYYYGKDYYDDDYYYDYGYYYDDDYYYEYENYTDGDYHFNHYYNYDHDNHTDGDYHFNHYYDYDHNFTNGDYYYDDDYYYDYDNFTEGDFYNNSDYYYSDEYLYYDYNYTNDKLGFRLLDEEFCSKYYSCNSTLRYCMCDASCDVFKDCCHDADLSNVNTTAEKLKDVLPYADCVYLPEVHSRWFIFVVNTCPLDAEKTLLDLCQNIDIKNIISSTPVFGNTSHLLYRNMYCAACHNQQYTSLNPQLSCGWRLLYEGKFTVSELLE